MTKMGVTFFIGILSSVLILSVMSFPTQAKEVWEDQGLEWYYDNLTDEDRQKIRQAMDYAIPRQQVIDGLIKGYGLPLATEIASNVMGYDSSIHAREYNLTKSKEILTEVFGKRYEHSYISEANTTITNTPYFNITLIAPITSIARTQWASLIAKTFRDIGLRVELKWWNWNIIMPRIFHDPLGIGLNHAHGGFDALFMESGVSIDPDLSKRYSQTSFVSGGENYQWIDNIELENMINQSLRDSDLKKRLTALIDFQVWFYEWVPKSIIHQDLDIFSQDTNWVGFDPYNYGRYPWVHNMTQGIYDPTATYTSVVPGAFVDFNPMISKSWYDAIWQSNVFLSLAGRRGIYNLSHPYPLLAESWSSTPDGLEWTVTLREGITFHDGSILTADDVIFSYEAAYDCPTSAWAGDMATWFDHTTNWIEKLGTYQIKFTLKTFSPYVESITFTIPILQKAQMEPIGYDNWKTHATNIGTVQLYGNGPYEFTSYDVLTGVLCDKYTGWDAALMGHNPSAVGGGIWLDSTYGPHKYLTVVILEATSAVINLQNGIVQLIDPNMGVLGQIEELEAGNWVKIVTYPAYSFHELGYNHYDPRWGLNPHDPRKMYPSDYIAIPFGGAGFSNRFLFGGFLIAIIVVLMYLLNRNRGTSDEEGGELI